MTRHPETIAPLLSTAGRRLLLQFGAEPWAYDTMPVPGRLELFQAGLLIGAAAGSGRWGAKLTDLGIAVKAIAAGLKGIARD